MWRFTMIVGCTALVLSGCFRAPVLEPKDVLAKVFYTSSSLKSFAYSAEVRAELRGQKVLSGSTVLHGVLLRSGPWSSDATVLAESQVARQNERMSGVVQLRAPGNGVLYVDASGLSGAAKPEAAQHDRWVRYALPGSVVHDPTPPSQSVIDQQVAAIEILEDATNPATHLYEYVVRIPSSMFLTGRTEDSLALQGTLWIDRTTFRLVRARWIGTHVPTAVGTLTFDADVTFSAYNEARLPDMPHSTGAMLPLETIFAIIL